MCLDRLNLVDAACTQLTFPIVQASRNRLMCNLRLYFSLENSADRDLTKTMLMDCFREMPTMRI